MKEKPTKPYRPEVGAEEIRAFVASRPETHTKIRLVNETIEALDRLGYSINNDVPGYLGLSQVELSHALKVLTAAPERLYEFIDSSRYFKVLGLFLLGAYIGRQRVFARLEELRPTLRRWLTIGLLWSIPMNLLYTAVSLDLIPCAKPFHTAVYTLAVYPLGLTYCLALSLLFLRFQSARIWRLLAYPGKMALTNYLSHSLSGLLIFYGVGLGLGAKVGLAETLLITLAVYLLLTLLSALWQRRFQYGPLEWLWRMWTYGKYLGISRPH